MSAPMEDITSHSSVKSDIKYHSETKEHEDDVSLVLGSHLPPPNNLCLRSPTRFEVGSGLAIAIFLTGLGLFVRGVTYDENSLRTAGTVLNGLTIVNVLALFLLRKSAFFASSSSPNTINHHAVDVSDDIENTSNEFWKGDDFKKFLSDLCKKKALATEKFMEKISEKILKSEDYSYIHERTRVNLIQDLLNLMEKCTQPIEDHTVNHIKTVFFQKFLDIQKYIKEIKEHIEQDKNEIIATFKPLLDKNAFESFQIELIGGETHNQGKKVCFIHFPEANLKIVYKPRSVFIDNWICGDQEGSLFKQVNQTFKSIVLPTYKILDKVSYGYTEYLSSSEKFESLEAERQYYETIGAVLALAQIFGIKDLHSDNILIHEGRPYFIDLEVFLNIESLLSKHGDKATEFAIPGNEKGIDESDETEKKEKLNKEEKEACVNKGFKKMKEWMMKSTSRSLLETLVKDIPRDLKMRFVPYATSSFVQAIHGYMTGREGFDQGIVSFIEEKLFFKFMSISKSKSLLDIQSMSDDEKQEEVQDNPCRIFSVAKEKKLKEAFLEDLEHCDVPIMSCDLSGKLVYKGIVVMDLSAYENSTLSKDLPILTHLVLQNIKTVQKLKRRESESVTTSAKMESTETESFKDEHHPPRHMKAVKETYEDDYS